MKKHLYQWAYVGIALIIIVLMYALVSSKKVATPNLDFSKIVNDRSFTEWNAIDLKVDSFIALAQRAYGDLLQVRHEEDVLHMTLANTNQLATDFFNNNNQLMKYKLKDFGFEIQNDAKTGSVIAQFFKKESNFVTVPNDVVVMMMYKAYNK